MILSLQVPPPKLPPSSTLWDWEKWVENTFVISFCRNTRIDIHKSEGIWWRPTFLVSFKVSVTIVKEIFPPACSNLGVFSCGHRGLWDSTRGIRQFSSFLRSFYSSSCLLLRGYSRTENQILVRNEEFRSRYLEFCCFDLVLSMGTSRFSFSVFGEVRAEGEGCRCCTA